ncbi:MAG TPA: SDR family NAD(P)-dependent oxidoreductase [Thermoanaerobaculia bacterium]|nr:SDR family NAD(P)-dependent oxidoreductase [Thermoanaerobaculia bacterium]
MSESSKVVLVTGGSSGIGRATALAFAREGATVVIVSRGVERGEAVRDELRGIAGSGEFMPADVSSVAEVQRVIRTAIDRFGRLDVAVNNAAAIEVGVFKETAAFEEEEFDAHMPRTSRASGRA